MLLLDVVILNIKEIIYEGKARSVKLPGENGVFEILPFHKPILSRLISGILFVDERAFPLKRGVVKVVHNEATVIIEE